MFRILLDLVPSHLSAFSFPVFQHISRPSSSLPLECVVLEKYHLLEHPALPQAGFMEACPARGKTLPLEGPRAWLVECPVNATLKFKNLSKEPRIFILHWISQITHLVLPSCPPTGPSSIPPLLGALSDPREGLAWDGWSS